MRTRWAGGCVLVALLAGAAGCGTSHIITNDPTARIWANGRLLGKGHAQIEKRGMPESTTIKVRTDDGRHRTVSVKRSVTWTTAVAALFTYGTCLIFCWEYPDTIIADFEPTAALQSTAAIGSNPNSDPWLTPPPGWQSRTTTAGTAGAAATVPAQSGGGVPSASPDPSALTAPAPAEQPASASPMIKAW